MKNLDELIEKNDGLCATARNADIVEINRNNLDFSQR